LAEIVPLAAPNVAVVHAAATVTDVGTVSAVTLLDSATLAPPVGATCVSVTVHVLEEFCPRLVGLQLSEETRTGATKPMFVVADLLL